MGALIGIAAFLLMGIAGTMAAYRNGVNDGYMAASEWGNPGYAKAVLILKHLGKWQEPQRLWQNIRRSLDYEMRSKWKNEQTGN